MTPEHDGTPSDEDLTAYLDGELDDVEADRIERLAAADPAIRLRIDRLAAVDERLRSAFPVEPEEPAIQRLTLRMSERSNVIQLPGRGDRHLLAAATRYVPTLLAASLALLIGFGGGFLTRGWEQPPAPVVGVGPVSQNTPLAALLDTHPTGRPITTGTAQNGGSLVIASTFTDRHGRSCREFETVDGLGLSGTVTAVGIACRDENRWVVNGLIAQSRGGAGASNITPSSDENRDALEALLAALGATKVMTPAEEAEIIERAWR